MTDPGFVVTLRDVYDKVTSLSETLETFARKQVTDTAVLAQRVDAVEKDIEVARRDHEDDRRLRVNIKWQMAGVLFAALTTSILPYLLLHH